MVNVVAYMDVPSENGSLSEEETLALVFVGILWGDVAVFAVAGDF